MAKETHVVMLPWSAFGHMIPFFHLSLALARRGGIRVSYVSTTRNIQRLPKVPTDLQNLVNLIALRLPTLDGAELPDGAEATVDVPEEKIEHLKAAYDLLKEPFRELVVELSPDWMIIDLMPHWAAEVAEQEKVGVVFFGVLSACSSVFLRSGAGGIRSSVDDWTRPPRWVEFPSTVAYTKHEATLFLKAMRGNRGSERASKVAASCRAMAVRTCPEFDGEYLKLLGKMMGKPVLPVGLLIPEKETGGNGGSGGSWVEIFEWMDGRDPKSVVFVGFGTEFKLSRQDVYEIAHGLELSGLPFLWALRRPRWTSSDLETLPPGFMERTSRIGRVFFGWAPQPKILSHPCIGGTLFHSGWGSIIESLQYGHALILLPFIFDQPLNARFLVEKGLGVEVARRDDGSFSGNDISEALKLAVGHEQGAEVRKKAREAAGGVFGNRKLQERYLDKFVDFLVTK